MQEHRLKLCAGPMLRPSLGTGGGASWGAAHPAYVAMTWTGASSIWTPSACSGNTELSAGLRARHRCGAALSPHLSNATSS